MAAITATKVKVLRGLVVDEMVGANDKSYALVEITATTTATSNTLDLATVVPAKGIAYPLVETIDEAVRTTASTWSTTTVTFAGHTGSGRYRGLWVIEQ